MKNVSRVWMAGLMATVVTVGTLIAQISAAGCILWWFEQPKMPESLIQKD